MTTDTTTQPRSARPYGVAALGVAAVAGSAGAVVAAGLALVLDDAAAALGALVGAGLTLLVLAIGFAVVDLVSGLMPAASLMVAMLTYTLQVTVLALLLAGLRRADGIERTLAPTWFAVGVITVAMSWTVCLVVHAMRARIPLYDLPEQSLVATAEGSDR